MKIKILAIAIILGLSACGGRSSNKQDSHTHDDGSVHSDHSNNHEQTVPEQESFKVEADTTIVVDTVKAKTHTHSHNEHTHSH